MKKFKLILSLTLIIALLALGSVASFAEEQIDMTMNVEQSDTSMRAGQNGTTLSSSVDANSVWTQEFPWDIHKNATPAEWDLFRGDTGTSRYTIDVTKGNLIEEQYVEGYVTVTNGGVVATENFNITVNLTLPPSRDILETKSVDVSDHPVLAPGESYDYYFKFDNLDLANYKVTADITITNHSGHLGTPFGPGPSDTLTDPSPTLINDEINVGDTNGGSWNFANSGSISYDKTFTCEDQGTNNNTATILETGQSASASVIVNCYDLQVSKCANTSYTRQYFWDITKTGDQSEVTLAKEQVLLLNYIVDLSATYEDFAYAATGQILVYNPAPISAVINSVSDIVSEDIDATVDSNVTFPYTIDSGETLTLTYIVDLPDATSRTNTATATLQNYDYSYDADPSASGTTAYSGTAAIDFANAVMTEIDKFVTVTDDKAGALGVVSYDGQPSTFQYSLNVGPYSTCGDYEYPNTATAVTNDTETVISDNWNVIIHVPCQGATLTIGYWKTHAGFGPQTDMVSDLLPIWLGNPAAAKSIYVPTAEIAVDVLRMKTYGDPSNGITKLYAQLLAAKLNIVNEADDSAVKATITLADNFLSSNDYHNWSTLSKSSKSSVLSWVTILDKYNNGIIGPGHATI